MKKRKILDRDILMASEMMLDYEPTVYGYNPKHANYNNYMLSDFDPHSLDGEQGKMYTDNSLDELNLESKDVEYLKAALWLYYV